MVDNAHTTSRDKPLLAASAEPYLCKRYSLLLPTKHATNQVDCKVGRAAAEAAPKRPAAVRCCYCGCSTKSRKDASHKQAGNQLPVRTCAYAVSICVLIDINFIFYQWLWPSEEETSRKWRAKGPTGASKGQQAKYTQVRLIFSLSNVALA